MGLASLAQLYGEGVELTPEGVWSPGFFTHYLFPLLALSREEKSMSKLGDLPISVVQQLCKHLNVEGAGVRNWRDLIAQPPGETS